MIAGYDVGSRVAQEIARTHPEAVRALVLAPPLAGAGDRVLSADAQREFWYRHFHRLGIIEDIIDGRPPAVRAYLEHFWSHWSGPGFMPSAAELDRGFPAAWSDRLDEFFSSAALQPLPGAGHFSPLEAPDQFAQWLRAAL